jgi:hypothetical protein
LIRAVSEELLASREERLASDRPPLFEVQDLTVEVSFVVTDSRGGGGGFDLKVVKADAKVSYDEQSIHRITLKLRALGKEDDVLPPLPDLLPLRPRADDGPLERPAR